MKYVHVITQPKKIGARQMKSHVVSRRKKNRQLNDVIQRRSNTGGLSEKPKANQAANETTRGPEVKVL